MATHDLVMRTHADSHAAHGDPCGLFGGKAGGESRGPDGLLRRMFAGLAEQTFFAELGVTDTPMVDYVAGMLARFVHRDSMLMVSGADGRPIEGLAAMLAEAERPTHRGGERRALYRHIGDYALFWAGVFPETLRRAPAGLAEHRASGRRCYLVASTYRDTPDQAAEAPVLRRLSEEFDLCLEGLHRVRDQLHCLPR